MISQNTFTTPLGREIWFGSFGGMDADGELTWMYLQRLPKQILSAQRQWLNNFDINDA